MSDFDDLVNELFRLKIKVAEQEHVLANLVKVAAVEEVDGQKGYRLKLGDGADGKPVLSPWYPHPESGGALKTWTPLTKGQVVAAIHPGGDSRQGFLVRAGFSDQNAQPSQNTGENKVTFGPYTITLDAGVLKISGGPVEIEAGGHRMRLTSSGTDFTGGKVRHDDKNIGSDHKHGGVQSGGAKTVGPE